MKKNIFIVAFNNMVTYGNGTTNVVVFPDKDNARLYVEREYLKKCEEEKIKEPYDTKSYDYAIDENCDYAYIYDKYYWDIFVREITF